MSGEDQSAGRYVFRVQVEMKSNVSGDGSERSSGGTQEEEIYEVFSSLVDANRYAGDIFQSYVADSKGLLLVKDGIESEHIFFTIEDRREEMLYSITVEEQRVDQMGAHAIAA